LQGRFSSVDDFEDAGFPEFNKPQQFSTSCPHLIETEAAENKALSCEGGIRLGHTRVACLFSETYS
jgi:hypothetical protein